MKVAFIHFLCVMVISSSISEYFVIITIGFHLDIVTPFTRHLSFPEYLDASFIDNSFLLHLPLS